MIAKDNSIMISRAVNVREFLTQEHMCMYSAIYKPASVGFVKVLT